MQYWKHCHLLFLAVDELPQSTVDLDEQKLVEPSVDEHPLSRVEKLEEYLIVCQPLFDEHPLPKAQVTESCWTQQYCLHPIEEKDVSES